MTVLGEKVKSRKSERGLPLFSTSNNHTSNLGVVNHVFDRRTGVVSAERCTRHLEYTRLNQSVRPCLLQGAATNWPEGTVKIDPRAGVVFSFLSCCPNWTSLFQREDRNGGIGHVHGTWRAQSCNLIAHESRTAYAVVRWKLYSSYYYIYFIFGFRSWFQIPTLRTCIY